MKKVIIPKDKSNQLFMAIEKNISSFRKRNISYVINAHSDDLATIILMVTGKKGTATKDIILRYDIINDWQLYVSGEKYILTSFSEISTIMRTLIQQMSVTLGRI